MTDKDDIKPVDEASSKQCQMKVFYDGDCYVCAHEIGLYQKRDKEKKIEFADISLDDFDATKEGLDAEEAMRVFHVRLPDGRLVVGVDAFIEIWERIPNFGWLAKIAKRQPIRLLLGLGYQVFIRIRPYLPRKKPTGAK